MRKEDTILSGIYESRIRKAIVLTLNKPTILSEIAGSIVKILELQKSLKITRHIKILTDSGILKVLTPKLKNNKPGKVYGLTDKGKRIKKKICLQDGIPFIYNEPENIDWHAYGWCLTGTQKKSIILALGRTPYSRLARVQLVPYWHPEKSYNFGPGKNSLQASGDKKQDQGEIQKPKR